MRRLLPRAQVTCEADLSRDVIKSDSAAVAVPEAELELAPGTLGGKVTTVEGLLDAISEKLASLHGFSLGDSAEQVSAHTRPGPAPCCCGRRSWPRG